MRLAALAQLPVERPADGVLRSQPHGQRHGQHDAAEQDPERQQQDVASQADLLERHRGREDEDEPLHADTDEPRRVDLHVDGADQHRSGQEAGEQVAEDQDDHGGDDVRQVAEDGQGKVGRHRGVEGAQAGEEAEDEDGPLHDARDHERGALLGRPLREHGQAGAARPLVEVEPPQHAVQHHAHDRRHDDGDEEQDHQHDDAGQEVRDVLDDATRRAAEDQVDLVPHGSSFRGLTLLVPSGIEPLRPAPARDQIGLLALERARKTFGPLVDGGGAGRPHLRQKGCDPAQIERRQRPQQVIRTQNPQTVPDSEVVDDACPQLVVQHEGLVGTHDELLQRDDRGRRQDRRPDVAQLAVAEAERLGEVAHVGRLGRHVGRLGRRAEGRNRRRAADALPELGAAHLLGEQRSDDLHDRRAEVGRVLAALVPAGAEQGLADRESAADGGRRRPDVDADAGTAVLPALLREQVFDEPARAAELPARRLAQPDAVEGAEQRIDDAPGEGAFLRGAGVVRRDEIEPAVERRLHERADPVGGQVRQARVDDGARTGAQLLRRAEDGGQRLRTAGQPVIRPLQQIDGMHLVADLHEPIRAVAERLAGDLGRAVGRPAFGEDDPALERRETSAQSGLDGLGDRTDRLRVVVGTDADDDCGGGHGRFSHGGAGARTSRRHREPESENTATDRWAETPYSRTSRQA